VAGTGGTVRLPFVDRPARARGLLETGITTLDQVAEMSAKDRPAIHGPGPKAAGQAT